MINFLRVPFIQNIVRANILIRTVTYPVTRILLIVLNSLCVLCGLLLLVVGVLYYLKVASFKVIKDVEGVSPQEVIAYGLICQSVILLIVHALGLVTVVTEILVISIIFTGSMFLAVITQFILFAIIFKTSASIKFEGVQERLRSIWKLIFGASGRTQSTAVSNMGIIQETFKCCGVDGAMDYKDGKLPNSCCEIRTDRCTVQNAYGKGCQEAVNEFLKENTAAIEYIIIGISAILLATTVIAIWHTCNMIRQKNNSGSPVDENENQFFPDGEIIPHGSIKSQTNSSSTSQINMR